MIFDQIFFGQNFVWPNCFLDQIFRDFGPWIHNSGFGVCDLWPGIRYLEMRIWDLGFGTYTPLDQLTLLTNLVWPSSLRFSFFFYGSWFFYIFSAFYGHRHSYFYPTVEGICKTEKSFSILFSFTTSIWLQLVLGVLLLIVELYFYFQFFKGDTDIYRR